MKSLLTFILKKELFLFLFICKHVVFGARRPEKTSREEVTGGCELPDIGAGNEIPALCKSSKHS